MKNLTLSYYEENADSFVSGTLDAEFASVQDRFLALLPIRAMILDFGCGSGRDTKYFLDKGFDVEAIDGSAELCKLASEFTGIKVKKMLFQELDETEKYDGIWACASILHLNKPELLDVIKKMAQAIKPNGIIYASFKYGDFEGYRGERYYTDFTEETFKDFIKDISKIIIKDQWISNDIRPGREDEKWINLVMQKVA